jgi:hypothetical protein
MSRNWRRLPLRYTDTSTSHIFTKILKSDVENLKNESTVIVGCSKVKPL